MFKILFGLVAALFFGFAQAQAVPATDPIPRVAFPLTQVGNVATIGPRTADAANAAKFSFGVATNGAIFANTGDRLPTPGGASIPIGVNGSISKPNVLAALGRFARKTLPPLALGHALYDLGQELGFGLDNSSGTLQVTTPAPGYCPTGPCYEWSPGTATFYRTPQAAANGYIGTFQSGCGTVTSVASVYTVGGGHPAYAANLQCAGQSNPLGPFGMSSRTRAVDTVPQLQPSTLAAFEAAAAAKNNWTAASPLARTMVEAIKAGETPLVQPQTITGPATSPGPTTSTHNATNNTTTLSAVTHNHTYSGAQISTTTVTNTTTINNTTSEVIAEEETTETPVIPEPQKLDFPCGGPGLPNCNVKIDEAGVPAAATATGNFNQGTTDLEAVRVDAIAAIDDAAEDDDLPGWSWTFALPTGCSPYAMEAFGLELDICQFQPIIHDIMSFLWLSAGVFGLLALFRSSVGT